MESSLLFFYGLECDHCERMMPLVSQLEKERGVTFTRYETWHNDENARLLESYDREFCGGVPFFYHKETEEWLCGEVPYETLKTWAQGGKGGIEGQ